MISLAAGLPLKWPFEVELMFESFFVISSAGSTLLFPDCELSFMRAADVFYLKQIMFACLPVMVSVVCIVIWRAIQLFFGKCNRRYCKGQLSSGRVNDYTILSIVLLLFLMYPMQVRIALSMLTCVHIPNDGTFLFADLEEPCFVGRHLTYTMGLFLPQCFLYVIGMPLASLFIVMFNQNLVAYDLKETSPAKAKSFRMRYGLLYMGYSKDRAWWETVISFRKVIIVVIASFGSMSGGVELQAYIALLMVFVSLIMHLIFKPFTNTRATSASEAQRALHNLEFAALCLGWATFFGGMIFFLGKTQHGALSETVLHATSLIIIVTNVSFLIVSILVFIKAYARDQHIIKKRRETKRLSSIGVVMTSIFPISDQDVTDK